MKLNVPPRGLPPSNPPDPATPGDIYMKAGGKPGYWVVVSVTPNGDCYVLAFDLDGHITGANRYSAYYFNKNCHRRVGRCEFSFETSWFP